MFFQTINQMMQPGVDFNLNIRQCDGKLVVAALPKSNGLKDQAQGLIAPITVSGTPEELDAGFLAAVGQPVQRATGLITNMKQFEVQADLAAANSKAAKEKTQKLSKETAEKKTSYDKNFKRGEELEKQGNYSDAIISFRTAKLHANDETMKIVDEKIRSLQAKLSQGSLFEVPAATAVTTPTSAEETVKPAEITPPMRFTPEPVFEFSNQPVTIAPSPDPAVDYEEDPDDDDYMSEVEYEDDENDESNEQPF